MKRFLSMQPTFRLDLSNRSADVIAQLRSALNTPTLKGNTVAAGNCIDFKIDERERRFWSPHLSVQISDTETGSQLFGRYSPRPEIWTMFMAIYAVTIIVIFGALIFGYVQWTLGTMPWALVIAPLGLLLLIGLHVSSLVGQSFSSDQMHQLRERLELALGELSRSPTQPLREN